MHYLQSLTTYKEGQAIVHGLDDLNNIDVDEALNDYDAFDPEEQFDDFDIEVSNYIQSIYALSKDA